MHSVYGIMAGINAPADGAEFNLSISTTKRMDANSLVWVEVFQSSGGNLDIKAANLTYSNLNITKILDI